MGVRNCQFVWLPSRVYAHACVLVHVWAWLHWWIHMHLGMIIRMHEYTCEHGRPKLYMHVGTTELSWCMRNIIIITALTRKATIQSHHKRSADKAKAYWFQLLSSKARQTHQKQGRKKLWWLSAWARVYACWGMRECIMWARTHICRLILMLMLKIGY
jgi:hypothetical protein